MVHTRDKSDETLCLYVDDATDVAAHTEDTISSAIVPEFE